MMTAASSTACRGDEVRGGDPEVAARRGLGAEDAVAPLDQVQVELEDAPLGERALERSARNTSVELARHGVRRVAEEQVLRELLRDRAAAAHHAALLEVAARRGLDLVPVEPAVLVEGVVLGDQHRAPQQRRDALVGHPALHAGAGCARRRAPRPRAAASSRCGRGPRAQARHVHRRGPEARPRDHRHQRQCHRQQHGTQPRRPAAARTPPRAHERRHRQAARRGLWRGVDGRWARSMRIPARAWTEFGERTRAGF